ncbi:uncharacterized protein LOC124255639 [Haliotis rubra]|uniref:uncharacterized protein LOC124255639 n=1 Tax=Haliotis rubra TaxID=36100 RepID=UPI001EE53977|nr:uncharacterized protein LOC124255639 [Haliotis rubra]
MTAITVALIYSNVLDVSHVGVTSQFSDCIHTCYQDLRCSSFFYGNDKCYTSKTFSNATPFTVTADVNYYGWGVGDLCPEPFLYHKPTGQCLYGEWVNKRNFTSAVSFCNSIGGRLAVTDESYKDKYLAAMGETRAATLWIGAKKDSGTVKWVTGATVGPFTNWDADPATTTGRLYNHVADLSQLEDVRL